MTQTERLAAFGYSALWLGGFAVVIVEGGDWEQALLLTVVPAALVWLFGRVLGSKPLSMQVVGRPFAALLMLLAIWALLLFLSSIPVRLSFGGEAIIKYALMIALPIVCLAGIGARPAPRQRAAVPAWRLWVAGAATCAILLLALPGRAYLEPVIKTDAFLAAILIVIAFVISTVAIAIPEEVFFRRLLQPRLTSALGSDWLGIFAGALLFGLIHIATFSQSEVVGVGGSAGALLHAVVFLSPMGVLLGYLWARTGSLPLVVVVHGVLDLPMLLASLK